MEGENKIVRVEYEFVKGNAYADIRNYKSFGEGCGLSEAVAVEEWNQLMCERN